jgi:hypothetical protein
LLDRLGLATAAAIYAVITALLFRDLLPAVHTHLLDLGDPLLNASILAWNARQVPLTESWWNFPSFAPLSGVTAFTEHLLATYPVASPIIWATGNAVLAHNVLQLGSFVLNGTATFALVRGLTRSTAAALVGGLAFAFSPYISVQLSHLQMLIAWGMPMALLALHRYLEAPRWRWLLAFATGWAVTALANAYMLVFFPLLVALWAIWIVPPSRWTRLVAPAVAAVLVVAAMTPLLYGYVVRQSAYGLTRSYDEILFYATAIRDVASISPRGILWRGWLRSKPVEGAIFPGLAIAALAIVAVAAAVRRVTRKKGSWRDPVFFYAAAAFLLWLLVLGPEPRWADEPLTTLGPYRALMWLPGVESIRVPPRAWLPATLCLAVLAGYGVAALQRRAGNVGRTMVVLAAVLVLAEGWFTEDVDPAPSVMQAGVIPRDAVVLDLPIEQFWVNTIAQYRAVIGGYRAVAGFSGYAPPHFERLRHQVADHDEEALNTYRRLADLYVIVRPEARAELADWIASREGATHLLTAPEWRLYRLPRLPGGSGTMPLPLPQPGSPAFAIH